MTEANGQAESSTGKGKVFFERAEEVAGTGNWDFAIELYLQGIQREPGNIERGHQPLREVALKRKAMRGKGPSLIDQWKRRPSRDPVKGLVNAEFLLSKEPGSAMYMEQMLKAAVGVGDGPVIQWVCELLLDHQRKASKRSKRILMLLTKSLRNVREFRLAIQAADMARELDPNDSSIQDMLGELAGEFALKQGGYEEEKEEGAAGGNFTRNVRDMARQKDLAQRDAMVKDEDYLNQNIEQTREEYLANPSATGKIAALVDALLAMEQDSYENEAIDVLTKAHNDNGAYQFKMRIGDIRIRQMTRRYRKLLAEGNKKAAAEQARSQLAFELEEFTERSLNYPTDMSIKFELGRRHYLAGNLDEAIAALQQAQRDPRRQLRATTMLGQAFAKKEWYDEASETFQRALEIDMTEDRAKEIRYYLGDAFEKMGKNAEALEQFSHVAQVDYNYLDVRERVDKLRQKSRGEAAAHGDEG